MRAIALIIRAVEMPSDNWEPSDAKRIVGATDSSRLSPLTTINS